ncbi:hypothetical protein LJR234_005407 [Mesorhizobium amorphae]|uniref:hypothetical protein n=1 Tax=Mesorhizobium amorphae TaxID=71433 RepID=UPI003ECD2F84
MPDSVILVLGGAFGVLVAYLTSSLALPTALHVYGQTKGIGNPLSVEEKQMREHFIRRLYMVASPLVCGVISAIVVLKIFGSGEWVH